MLQGEIEKTGELVDVERPSPPKKRRRAKPEMPLEEELPRDPAAKTEVKKKKKRPEREGAAPAAGGEAKGGVSRKARLKEEGGASAEGMAKAEKTKRSKDEAVVGEVRKVKRVKRVEKVAIPSQQIPGVQATTDAPSSAAPPPANIGTHAGAQSTQIYDVNGITVFCLSFAVF